MREQLPLLIAVGAGVVVIIAVAAYWSIGGFGSSYHSNLLDFKKEGDLTILSPDGTALSKIDIEIAQGDQEMRAGLMYRRALEADQGMLFIFPGQDIRTFWMRTTYIPLDLIFIDSANQIVSIAKNAVPESEKRINSGRPALCVLEVQAGFCDRFGVTENCSVVWSATQPSDSL